jgi:hypothetical protein
MIFLRSFSLIDKVVSSPPATEETWAIFVNSKWRMVALKIINMFLSPQAHVPKLFSYPCFQLDALIQSSYIQVPHKQVCLQKWGGGGQLSNDDVIVLKKGIS